MAANRVLRAYFLGIFSLTEASCRSLCRHIQRREPCLRTWENDL